MSDYYFITIPTVRRPRLDMTASANVSSNRAADVCGIDGCVREPGHVGHGWDWDGKMLRHAIPNRVACDNPICIHADHPADDVRHVDKYGVAWTGATRNRAAIEPCFPAIPEDRQKTATCRICHAPYTRLTELHWAANACTGCMLRTLRPFDYTQGSAT